MVVITVPRLPECKYRFGNSPSLRTLAASSSTASRDGGSRFDTVVTPYWGAFPR
ncbi:hypothetical protein RAJCM14343_0513 [Rhodococcus aetherivorans]|uniref:Uncharacterized protein n=1 Tax=Rhodococcus aetherivorans TaxID=191292 RepID=A0ABQ0YFH2_9NOCA|nr:hypothetical protein RAJCM14343_0513 [Rhodococcus aetherivorans]